MPTTSKQTCSHPSPAHALGERAGDGIAGDGIACEAVAGWVQLLDEAECQMMRHDPLNPVAQRTASRLLDALVAHEHTLTPAQRRHARELVWRRDCAEPLPDEERRRTWSACVCPRCRLARQRDAASARLARRAPSRSSAHAS